jgi:peroxiredoxin
MMTLWVGSPVVNGSTGHRISLLLAAASVAVLAFAVLKPRSRSHPVTAAMTASAGAIAGQRSTAIEGEGTDGKLHSPVSDSLDHPLVLFFIQDGCPCSEAAEPYFQRLERAHGRAVMFLGVIDGDIKTARDWASRHETRYPIVADPKKRIIAACHADRSAYVMLVAPGGTIEVLWPGYSSRMLAELDARLSRLTGEGAVPLDNSGAPNELASGCAF